jgi:hypothetical protein
LIYSGFFFYFFGALNNGSTRLRVGPALSGAIIAKLPPNWNNYIEEASAYDRRTLEKNGKNLQIKR